MKIQNLKQRIARFGVPKGWDYTDDYSELVRIPEGHAGFRPEADRETAETMEQYYLSLEQQQPIDPEEFHIGWQRDKNNSRGGG